jgi:phosphoadenosine phosphosulfate reductase
MWKLIEKYGFPTRHIRFCCERLKEVAGQNAYCILGIRWAESIRRKKGRAIHEIAGRVMMTNNDNEATRRMNENCMKKNKFMLNPIIDWSDNEVWEYIHERVLPYNPLYDSGHKRVGCIGCPMRNNKKELEDNPKWAALYKKSAFKFLQKPHPNHGQGNKKDIDTYYQWWIDFCAGKRRNKV